MGYQCDRLDNASVEASQPGALTCSEIAAPTHAPGVGRKAEIKEWPFAISDDVHINGGCEMQNPPRYSINPADLQAAYDEFMREGYLNDENSGFGTAFFKERLDELEQGFRSIGYDGEAFEHGGKYFAGNGNVLWIYDPDRLSANQAHAKTEAWVASAPQRALRNP